MMEDTARMPAPAIRRRAWLLGLPVLLVLGLLALAASSAQALVVTSEGHPVSYEPLLKGSGAAGPNARTQAKPLAKKGLENPKHGPVMPSNTNYVIYWDPPGGTTFPAGYETGINTFFEDLGHDRGKLFNTDSVLTQYGANYDSHFAAALSDTDPYPSNGCTAAETCLSEAQIEAEVLSFVQSHSLPTDLEHEYFVLTPQGVESCNNAGTRCSAGAENAYYCAFHNFIDLGKGAVIVYASDPYVSGLKDTCADEANRPNGNPSDDTIAGGLAHEHSESVTDPELNAWMDKKGQEVADKCRHGEPEEYGTPLGTAPNGSKYNELINADEYWYQQVWSNELGACAQRQLQVPTIKKLKPKKGLETGGTVVTIVGTGFTEGATVEFGELEASEVVFESSTSLRATTPPEPAGKVPVTVTTEGGTTTVTNKTQFTYKKAKGK